MNPILTGVYRNDNLLQDYWWVAREDMYDRAYRLSGVCPGTIACHSDLGASPRRNLLFRAKKKAQLS
ncbi:MAG: hypothetical protein WCC37_05330, partial [Candidatus Sulfotelmatobacter sp.]